MSRVDTEVAIVGSGFSGLGMAIQCKKARRDFIVFEKSTSIGGTWRENTYPGCACDVPAHLYSFSFALNPSWSRLYAPQAEIRQYLERCVDDFGVRDGIRLESEVVRCTFDDRSGTWRLEIEGHEAPVTARYLVFGTGPLSQPGFPSIPGMETFEGTSFHSAGWDHECDLEGKRVAVIGTGASAIQLVPQIVDRVSELHVYQRTPPWVLPKPDRAIEDDERSRFRRSDVAHRLFRWKLYWGMELRGLPFTVNTKLMSRAAEMGRAHIRAQVEDPAMRAVLTPTYTPGCKRILLADDWYPALGREHVELVTDSVARVTPTGIETEDGAVRDVDVIIYATGFRASDVLARTSIIGRGGVELDEVWKKRLSAYLGTTITGFPNFFMLLGPNTGLGHNSMVFMIESQVHYALECMKLLEKRGGRFLEVRPREQVRFNESLVPRLAKTVWATGCNSWYLDSSGHNFSAWPGPTFEYWWRTRRALARHYNVVGKAVDRPHLHLVPEEGAA